MPASFLVLSLLLMLPLWLSGQPRLLGYGADSAMHLWFFEWFPFAITHGLNPFVTSLATSPQQVNLLWNNADLPLALLAWPLVQVVGGAVAMGVVYTVLMAAAAAAMAWQLRPWVRHASAAWLGGLLFGFSPFAQSELAAGHLTWVTTATLPLGWWVGQRAIEAARRCEHRVRWGLAGGGWLVLQYWASKELLATSLLMMVLLLAVHLLRGRLRDLGWLRNTLPVVAAAGLLVVALMAFPLVMQLSGAVALSRPTVVSPTADVVDLLAFIVPGYAQLVSPGAVGAISQHFSGIFLETDAYLGLPLVVLAVWVGLRRRSHPLAGFGIACAGLAALLALGPWLHVAGTRIDLPLPWLLIGRLPLYAKAVPSRMTVFVVAGVACLLAAGWDHLVGALRPAARIAVVGLVFLPLLPSLGIIQGYAGFAMYLPQVFSSRQLRALPAGSVVVSIPWSTRGNHGLTMYWQAESGFRFAQPFGYLLHAGPGGVSTDLNTPSPLEKVVSQLTLNQAVTTRPRSGALLVQLRRWHVAAIVVTRRHGFDFDVSTLKSLLGRSPKTIAGAAVWFYPGRRSPTG
jgi:hypothetical protein